MKNCRAPRTLSDAQFFVGYPIRQVPRRSSAADIAAAIVVGIVGAALLMHWMAS